MNAIPILFLAVAGALPLRAEPSVDPRAEVILPFADVKALLEAAQSRPEPPPPISAAVTNAVITVSPADRTANAEYEIDVFGKDWPLVRLLRTPFLLETSAVSPSGSLVTQDGMICLLSTAPGHVKVKLTFSIPTSLLQPGAAPTLVQTGAVTAGRVVIRSLPEGTRPLFKCADGRESGDSATPLPSSGGETGISLVEDKPLVPTTWNAHLRTVIRQLDDRLACEARIRLNGTDGSGVTATLEMPPGATGLEIDGRDCRQSAPWDSGSDLVNLTWETPGRLEREIRVRYELSLPAESGIWRLQPPRVLGAASADARTVLVPAADTEFHVKKGPPVASPATLPGWMKISGAPALEIPGSDAFEVTARRLPRLRTDTARIPQARFQTQVVADGARLCEGVITLQHRGPLRWRFSLPGEAEPLSCEVNNRSASPLRLDDGLLELEIPAEADRDTRTEVKFSFTTRGKALAPVEGRLDLALPSTPLFIEDLSWALALPSAYEITAFEGNVEPDAGAALTFHKRLVRNDAPSLQIFYRKQDSKK